MGELSRQYSPYPWHWPDDARIAYYAHAYGSLTATYRSDEIIRHLPDAFRVAEGYYEHGRRAASVTEASFARAFPEEYRHISRSIKPINERWQTAAAIHKELAACLDDAAISGYFSEHRAKSAFSVWRKMQRTHIDADEVFDIYGMRFIAKDMAQADAIVEAMQIKFPLMEPHVFRHRAGAVHSPVRGGFEDVNDRGYASLRMNFIHAGEVFEVQILTEDMLRHQLERLRKSYEQLRPAHTFDEPAAWQIFDDYKDAVL